MQESGNSRDVALPTRRAVTLQEVRRHVLQLREQCDRQQAQMVKMVNDHNEQTAFLLAERQVDHDDRAAAEARWMAVR